VEAETDERGRFQACSVPGGTPLTVIAAFGRANERLTLTVEAGDTRRIGIQVDAPRSRATGRVVEDGTNRGIGDAEIHVARTPIRVTSAGDGSFRLPDLPAGRYLLETSHLGFGTRSDTVEVEYGSIMLYTIGLAPEAIVLQPIDVAVRSVMLEQRGFYGVIARYARGRDYHRVLKSKLMALLRWLEAEIGHELPLARAYVDTGPVLEREFAQRAGLGWFGRNTMLLHPKRGSYFFLGSLLLDIELEADAPFDEGSLRHVQRVRACVSDGSAARPRRGGRAGHRRDTLHIVPDDREPRADSARAAQFDGEPCVRLRHLSGGVSLEFGKFVTLTRSGILTDGSGIGNVNVDGNVYGSGNCGVTAFDALPSLISLMRMTYEEWDEWTRGSAMRRSGYAGLKRNVAVALGNWGSEEAVPVLVEALSDAEPLVRGHAAWALGEIGAPSAWSALTGRLDVEDDPWVREELELALARFTERSSSRGRSGAERSVT
jgi:epoxyqueuosine reductase